MRLDSIPVHSRMHNEQASIQVYYNDDGTEAKVSKTRSIQVMKVEHARYWEKEEQGSVGDRDRQWRGGALEYRISMLILVNEQALSPGRGYHKREKEGVCLYGTVGTKGRVTAFSHADKKPVTFLHEGLLYLSAFCGQNIESLLALRRKADVLYVTYLLLFNFRTCENPFRLWSKAPAKIGEPSP